MIIPLITPKTNFKSMKGLEFIFLGMGSVLGAFLRYKLTESPLIFNTLPVNVLIVNIAGAFILGIFVVVSQQWHLIQNIRYLLLLVFVVH